MLARSLEIEEDGRDPLELAYLARAHPASTEHPDQSPEFRLGGGTEFWNRVALAGHAAHPARIGSACQGPFG